MPEPKQLNIQDLIDVHSKQQEEFNSYITSLKSIELNMKEVLDNLKVKSTNLDLELKKSRDNNYAIDLVKKDIEKKQSDINIALERANQKEIYLNNELKRAEQRHKEVGIMEASIQSQRQDLCTKDQAIDERYKWLKMEERSLKATRLEIEKIIRDNNLKIVLGEE